MLILSYVSKIWIAACVCTPSYTPSAILKVIRLNRTTLWKTQTFNDVYFQYTKFTKMASAYASSAILKLTPSLTSRHERPHKHRTRTFKELNELPNAQTSRWICILNEPYNFNKTFLSTFSFTLLILGRCNSRTSISIHIEKSDVRKWVSANKHNRGKIEQDHPISILLKYGQSGRFVRIQWEEYLWVRNAQWPLIE